MKIYEITGIEFLEGEEWRDMVGFEGYYQVSSLGRIKRLKTSDIGKDGKVKTFQPHVLKQQKQRGYMNVMVSVNNVQKRFRIHRLIGLAFIPNPDNKPYINHKNGIRDDNRVVNLEWSTNSENQLHAYRVLGKQSPRNRLGKTGALCSNSKPVFQYDNENNLIRKWPAASEAARHLKVTQSSISTACKRGTRVLGFKWRLFDNTSQQSEI